MVYSRCCRLGCAQYGRVGLTLGFRDAEAVDRYPPGKYAVSLGLRFFVLGCHTEHLVKRLQNKAMTVANDIMNVFNKDVPDSIKKCRILAEQVFGEKWEAKGAIVYDEGPKKVNVWGIGQYVSFFKHHKDFFQIFR